jgi:glycosyl transferase family 25
MILQSRVRKLHDDSEINGSVQNYNISALDAVYINLKHREDRNLEVIKEFKKIGLTRVIRFEAIMRENGALGCALSHHQVLNDWNFETSDLLMICEDDIVFAGDANQLNKLLLNFQTDNNLDILCLGYNHRNEYSYNDLFFLTSDTQTASCYVVKPHMKEILLKFFDYSIHLLKFEIDKAYQVEIDKVWKILQKKYNFVIPKERFAYQRESFSDIEHRIVNYDV